MFLWFDELTAILSEVNSNSSSNSKSVWLGEAMCIKVEIGYEDWI